MCKFDPWKILMNALYKSGGHRNKTKTKVNKMNKNELIIDIPEGMEIDREKSTFEKIVFKKKAEKALPKDMHEYMQCVGGYLPYRPSLNEGINLLTNLIRIRDYYNNSCTLDQQDPCYDYSITYWRGRNEWIVLPSTNTEIFTFKNRELAHEFFSNFKDDLEKIQERLYVTFKY